jgi:tRNA threonylcarbamoyladenosine biosynthesis protein TsaE
MIYAIATMSRATKTVKSEEEMFAFAADFIERIKKLKISSRKSAVIIGLTGELGAGKTTFVKGVARALGVRETVTSPTFVIMKIYKLVRQPWRHLIHVDVYRLESAEELRALGWDEIASDPANIILIEWVERVRDLLPRGHHAISFECTGEHERRVSLLSTTNHGM